MKSRIVIVIAVLGLALGGVVVAKPVPTSEATGTVYDVDFGSMRTQILIQPPDSTGQDTYFVASSLLQDVLQASFISKRELRVKHSQRNIIEVTLLATPTDPCSGDGCVQEIRCTANECSARIAGIRDPVKTTNRRALGVLVTAVSDGRKVDDLLFDGNRTITRVKVNKP